MSVSAFHHHFKAVTSTSPLQYFKTVRLHKARMLILHDGIGAAVAADRVGYESASQFSREFKRLFGHSPTATTLTPDACSAEPCCAQQNARSSSNCGSA